MLQPTRHSAGHIGIRRDLPDMRQPPQHTPRLINLIQPMRCGVQILILLPNYGVDDQSVVDALAHHPLQSNVRETAVLASATHAAMAPAEPYLLEDLAWNVLAYPKGRGKRLASLIDRDGVICGLHRSTQLSVEKAIQKRIHTAK